MRKKYNNLFNHPSQDKFGKNNYLQQCQVNSSDVISMRDANGVEIAEVDLLFSVMGWDLVVTNTNTNETLVLGNT